MGPANQIDVDLCRQSEDGSMCSSDDDSDEESDYSSSCQDDEKGGITSDPQRKSELLTPIATTSKRKRPDETNMSKKSKPLVETVAEDAMIAKHTSDLNNSAMQSSLEANAENEKLGNNHEDDDVPESSCQQAEGEEEQVQQPMIQIQFVMGSHLEEQHPAAMALLTNNDDDNGNPIQQDDDDDGDDETDDSNTNPASAEAQSDRLRVVDKLLTEQKAVSSDKSETQRNSKNVPEAKTKSLITELN